MSRLDAFSPLVQSSPVESICAHQGPLSRYHGPPDLPVHTVPACLANRSEFVKILIPRCTPCGRIAMIWGLQHLSQVAMKRVPTLRADN